MSEDSKELTKEHEHRARWYANFAGILIGFSMSIAVLIVALVNEGIEKVPQYSYSLAAFIYSALAFFSTYTWFGRALEQPEIKRYYRIGSLFYYTGYWSLLLGLIYLTTLIQLSTLNYPFIIPCAFLLYTFIINLKESVIGILKFSKLDGILLLVLLILFIIIAVLTIPIEPFLALLEAVH